MVEMVVWLAEHYCWFSDLKWEGLPVPSAENNLSLTLRHPDTPDPLRAPVLVFKAPFLLAIPVVTGKPQCPGPIRLTVGTRLTMNIC